MKDTNHATIVTEFSRASAYVIDLSKLGFYVPDLLVGYAGTERLVEIKVEADARPKRERMRPSTRCGTCGKTYRSHRLKTARTKDLATGEKTDCEKFAVQMVAAPRAGGKVSKGQEAFAREWPGSPIVVVRTKDDVQKVLSEMAASAVVRKAVRGFVEGPSGR